MINSRNEGTSQHKFEYKSTQQTPTESLHYWQILTGMGLNTHIPHDTGAFQFPLACFRDGGFVAVSQYYLQLAKASGMGIFQSWMANFPVYFITDSDLIFQVANKHHPDLVNSEADGVQERSFGKGTIISLDKEKDKEEYEPKRAVLMLNLFKLVGNLVDPLQAIFLRYILGELQKAAEKGEKIDLPDLAKRIAFTAISETQLGFVKVDEKSKSDYANFVLEGINTVANPIYTLLFKCQKIGSNAIGRISKRLPSFPETNIKASINSNLSRLSSWCSSTVSSSRAAGFFGACKKTSVDAVSRVNANVPQCIKQAAQTSYHSVTSWCGSAASSAGAYFAAPFKNIYNRIAPTVSATAAQVGETVYEHLRYPLKFDRVVYRGEKILKKIIKDNEPTVLEKMKAITGKQNLTAKDLYHGECFSTIKLFLTGGFETTSKLVLFVLYMQADPANKEFLEKMRAEIAGLLQSRDPMKFKWTREELFKLKYTKAFADEILRFFPPFSYQRHTAKNDFELVAKDGRRFFIPAGSMFVLSAIDAHRNTKYWGPDADKFNPMRSILDESKKINIDMVHTKPNLNTFGNDDRVCPGRKFSEQEGMLIGAMIAFLFDLKVEITKTIKGKKVPITLSEALNPGFTLELKKGVEVSMTLTQRTVAPEYKSAPPSPRG